MIFLLDLLLFDVLSAPTVFFTAAIYPRQNNKKYINSYFLPKSVANKRCSGFTHARFRPLQLTERCLDNSNCQKLHYCEISTLKSCESIRANLGLSFCPNIGASYQLWYNGLIHFFCSVFGSTNCGGCTMVAPSLKPPWRGGRHYTGSVYYRPLLE